MFAEAVKVVVAVFADVESELCREQKETHSSKRGEKQASERRELSLK